MVILGKTVGGDVPHSYIFELLLHSDMVQFKGFVKVRGTKISYNVHNVGTNRD